MTSASPLQSLYAFGDSLVDDGKAFGTFPLAPLFGADPFPVSPPYADGRYSNGPMWTEHLAESLGIPSDVDRNFAFGGATARFIDDPIDPLQTLANFDGQVDLFEATFDRFQPTDLVAVNFGGNDLPLIARLAFETGAPVESGIDQSVGAVIDGLDRLAALGAERFLVNALPDLALVPFIRNDPEGIEAEFGVDLAGLTDLTILFNETLATEITAFESRTGHKVLLFDTFDLFERIIAEPSTFGIEFIEEAVLLTGSTALSPVFNPAIDGRDPNVADATLFFDQNFHPTTAVHAIMAEEIREDLILGGLVPPADPAADGVVFRFFNTLTGGHFYTASQAERDAVGDGLPEFSLEGAAFQTATLEPAVALPVFRFFNTATEAHFYTLSEEERDAIQKTHPVFLYEGEAFDAYAAPVPGSVPLFRFFNTETGTHFYTTDPGERDMVHESLPQFQFEGISAYVEPLIG